MARRRQINIGRWTALLALLALGCSAAVAANTPATGWHQQARGPLPPKPRVCADCVAVPFRTVAQGTMHPLAHNLVYLARGSRATARWGEFVSLYRDLKDGLRRFDFRRESLLALFYGRERPGARITQVTRKGGALLLSIETAPVPQQSCHPPAPCFPVVVTGSFHIVAVPKPSALGVRRLYVERERQAP